MKDSLSVLLLLKQNLNLHGVVGEASHGEEHMELLHPIKNFVILE